MHAFDAHLPVGGDRGEQVLAVGKLAHDDRVAPVDEALREALVQRVGKPVSTPRALPGAPRRRPASPRGATT